MTERVFVGQCTVCIMITCLSHFCLSLHSHRAALCYGCDVVGEGHDLMMVNTGFTPLCSDACCFYDLRRDELADLSRAGPTDSV